MWNAVSQRRAVTTGDTRERSRVSCRQAAVASLGWGQQSWGPSTSQQALSTASDKFQGVYGDAWGWSSLGMSLLLHLVFLPKHSSLGRIKVQCMCVCDTARLPRMEARHGHRAQMAGDVLINSMWEVLSPRWALSPPAWLPALHPGWDQ